MAVLTLSRFRYTALPILLIGFIVSFSILFNFSIIDVRLDELDRSLYNIARNQDLNKSLNMLARYAMVQRRLQRGREDVADYTMESKVSAVISSDFFAEEKSRKTGWNKLYPLARLLMNGIRTIMGKEIEKAPEELKEYKELEVAYFYERNRRYEMAIDIYEKFLKVKHATDRMDSFVLLHLGYCYSMIGNIEQTKKNYEKAIQRFPDSESSIVAWKLLDFINSLEDEVKRVNSLTLDEFARSEQFFLLMDYRSAIKSFAWVIKETKNPGILAKAMFLKGRSHEELGEADLAIDNYREVINKYPKSEWAKEANRRFYILGEFYERDQAITQMAVQRLEEFRDQNFFNELKQFSEMVQDTKIREQMQKAGKEKIQSKISEGEKDVLKIIEGLKLDLDGKKAEIKDKEKKEELIKVMTAQLKAETQMAELRDELTSHPYRSGSFILRTMKYNYSNLRYVYQQYLRRGEKFSGTIVFSFEIEQQGQLSNLRIVSSNINRPNFEKDIMNIVQRWRFPAVDAKFIEPLKVANLPITFSPHE